MSNSPTLLVLAAGMGSRYGGLKQMDPMGPNGEFIIDYSVYDAVQSGFGKVVFVVRPELEADFRSLVASRFEDRIEVAYAHQCLDDLPDGFSLPADRQKPWGTGHAILVAEPEVDSPLCVINGDDFYGPDAFRQMGDFLRGGASADAYGMIAYILRNTLSDHGSVARGVCEVSDALLLQSVTERTNIVRDGNGAKYEDEQGGAHLFSGDERVSLNFWGFHPSIFTHLREQFTEFLETRIDEPKAEYFIPTVVDQLIQSGQASVQVMTSTDNWFGVTYPQDKPIVQANLQRLTDAGTYPRNLWA